VLLEPGEPSDEIVDLVKSKNGCLIPIDGFDQMLFMLSRKMEFENPETAMRDITEARIKKYNDQNDEFAKRMKETSKTSTDESTKEVVKEVGEYYEQLLSDINTDQASKETFEGFMKRADTYHCMSKYEEAIGGYTKAIELNLNSAEAYKNREYLYSQIREYERAISDLFTAIKLNPDFSNSYKHILIIYYDREKYEKALKFVNIVIELKAKYKEAYEMRAKIYHELGEPEKAAEDEEKVCKMDNKAATMLG